MTTEVKPAADAFAALLATLGTVGTENTAMVKALDDSSEFVMDADGKPKMGDDGKPMRKTAMLKDDGADPDMMGKAFTATIDGVAVEGIDATEMLKALDGDMVVMRTALPKLVGALQVQGNLIKALQGELTTLRGTGVGRRAMLAVADRPTLTAPAADLAKAEGQLSPGEFMLKALDASRKGLITSLDCARLDATMNRGLQPDPNLVAIVLGSKS